MEIELVERSIPSEFLKKLFVRYKGRQLKKEYEADTVCYEKIIVEYKSLDKLSGKEEAQVLNYLKATGFRVGLLINFGSVGALEWKRFIK
ncbi:MAG TPA: GxxExxY protein [Bacteroidota bacterium]